MESILNGIRKRYHERSIDVDEALYQKALRGDPRAIELWYKRMENWNPKEQHEEREITFIISSSLVPPEYCTGEETQTLTCKAGTKEIAFDEEEPCIGSSN